MQTMDAELNPGWLKQQIADVAALDRACKKIVRADEVARRNGYTQPMALELTIPELRALAYIARVCM